MKQAKFSIDHSDPAYPKIVKYRGIAEADGSNSFNTLGEAKKYLLKELKMMKEHYQGLINDVYKVTKKSLAWEEE